MKTGERAKNIPRKGTIIILGTEKAGSVYTVLSWVWFPVPHKTGVRLTCNPRTQEVEAKGLGKKVL